MSYTPTVKIDNRPFARGGSVTIVVVSLVHIYQAILWSIWPAQTGGATCLIYLLRSMHALDSPDGATFASLMMIAGAILALIGALFRFGWIRILLFIPQQAILCFMAGGGMVAVQQGAYLDGTVIPWQHISADQIWPLAVLVIHTSAILRRCWDPNG